MWSLGLNLLLLSLTSVIYGKSTCIVDTLRCARQRIPFGAYKHLAETAEELDEICRVNSDYYQCLERVMFRHGNKFLPRTLEYSRRLASNLCSEGSVWRQKYLKWSRCINDQNTDSCITSSFVRSISNNEESTSKRCALLAEVQNCIADTIEESCELEAVNVFRFLLRISNDGDSACDSSTEPWITIKKLEAPSPTEIESRGQNEYAGVYETLLKRIGTLDDTEPSEELKDLDECESSTEKLDNCLKIKKNAWHYKSSEPNRSGDLSTEDFSTTLLELSEEIPVTSDETGTASTLEDHETDLTVPPHGESRTIFHDATIAADIENERTLFTYTADENEQFVPLTSEESKHKIAERESDYSTSADTTVLEHSEAPLEHSEYEFRPKTESEEVTFDNVRARIEQRLARAKSNSIFGVLGIHEDVQVRKFPDGSIALYWREMNDAPFENMTCYWEGECKEDAIFQCLVEPRIERPVCPVVGLETSVDFKVRPELIDPELGGKVVEEIGKTRVYYVKSEDTPFEQYKSLVSLKETTELTQLPLIHLVAATEETFEGMDTSTGADFEVLGTTSDFERMGDVLEHRRGIPTPDDFVKSQPFSPEFLAEVNDSVRANPSPIKTVTYYTEDGSDVSLKATYFSNGGILMSFTQEIFGPIEKVLCIRVNECHPAASRVFRCTMTPKTDLQCPQTQDSNDATTLSTTEKIFKDLGTETSASEKNDIETVTAAEGDLTEEILAETEDQTEEISVYEKELNGRAITVDSSEAIDVPEDVSQLPYIENIQVEEAEFSSEAPHKTSTGKQSFDALEIVSEDAMDSIDVSKNESMSNDSSEKSKVHPSAFAESTQNSSTEP